MSRGVLVLATPRALRSAEDVGFNGVIEVAVERAIETSEPTLRIGRTDICYRIDERLRVRVRDLGERTKGGRRKLLLTGVIDVLRPPGGEL